MSYIRVLPQTTSQRPWCADFTPQGANLGTAFSMSSTGLPIGRIIRSEHSTAAQFARDVNHLIGCVNAFGAIERPEASLGSITNAIHAAVGVLGGLFPKTEYQLMVHRNLLSSYEMLRKR